MVGPPDGAMDVRRTGKDYSSLPRKPFRNCYGKMGCKDTAEVSASFLYRGRTAKAWVDTWRRRAKVVKRYNDILFTGQW
jgi:hypothetical protein